MNKQDRNREKQIKHLLYIKSQLIRQLKKECKELRLELNRLGGNKDDNNN